MEDITLVVLTKNEEINIERCVRSCLNVVKRMVIIDSYSNDNTEELCMSLKKECASNNVILDFYQNDWVDHSTQFNWGIDNTLIDTEWILRLDADEYLTDELAEEIISKLHKVDNDVNGIAINRRVVFMGKWIKHGGMYPRYLVRLFRNGYGRCEKRKMDEHIVVEGKIIKFSNDFIDENKKDLSWWIVKHNGYSDKERKEYVNSQNNREKIMPINSHTQAARIRFIKEKIYYNLPILLRAKLYYFFRYYVLFGFLDGTEGRIFHFLQAYWYRFLVDAKIFENRKE